VCGWVLLEVGFLQYSCSRHVTRKVLDLENSILPLHPAVRILVGAAIPPSRMGLFGRKKDKKPEAAAPGSDPIAEPEPEPSAEPSVDQDAAASPYFGTGVHRVDKESFELIRVLGQGRFGQVFLVRKRDTGAHYAMKVLKKKNLVARRQVEHTRAERSVLERMRGVPFIVHVRYAFQSHDKLYLVRRPAVQPQRAATTPVSACSSSPPQQQKIS
jgi:hypothetical protein